MRIERFGHAGLTVADLATAEAFYGDILGCAPCAHFPEDEEVMLTVGRDDHLLLKRIEPSVASPGLHHLALQVREGHRELAAAVQALEARGIWYRWLDHDGDPSVYFRDPDRHLLELYAAPGATPHFATAGAHLAAARRFVHTTARLVDRTIHACCFEAGSPDQVLTAVCGYRNADGGFGHALEPDVRCPSSQPLHTLTALELLREAGIRAPQLADGCCDFLARLASRDTALPALRSDAVDHPLAAHWQNPAATAPSPVWTIGLAAELVWHGARHPWAARAVQAGRGWLTALASEAHGLLYAVRFASTVLTGDARIEVLRGLCDQIAQADFFVAETPVLRYGLTPLHYAPGPQAPAAGHFGTHLL